jgi:hypothetical protein
MSVRDLSDEDLLRRLQNETTHNQQTVIFEANRRQSEKLIGGVVNVQSEVEKVRQELGIVKSDLALAQKQLGHTHKIHVAILWVAIITAMLALIAALDPVLRWFGVK